jgi:hypothetical protein
MLFRIPDTNFSISESREHRIPDPDPPWMLIADPGSGFVSHPGSLDPDPQHQCCGSEILFFTHLGSWIQKQQQKRGVKKISCHAFFVATNFT